MHQISHLYWRWVYIKKQGYQKNFGKFSEIIESEEFRKLQQVLYAKKSSTWDGTLLLLAYEKIKKQYHKHSFYKTKNKQNLLLDPLPPLNP